MKIQHIRGKHCNIIATLAAVKDEAKGVVNFGYAVVRDGDNPRKKVGTAIAQGRALKGGKLVVPSKIKEPFVEFLKHCQDRYEFDGFHLPVVEDFQFEEPFRVRKQQAQA